MILNYDYENNCSRNLVVEKECGTLFIVSGPSGVGKTTIVTRCLQQYEKDYRIERMVTYTTKTPRVTEVHGIDYHFISQEEFDLKVAQDFFLEWSGEYGACYGTPSYVLEQLTAGISFVLVIDRAGAAQIIKKYPQAVLIWVQVSSMDALSDRLNKRKTESFEQIQTRLLLAKKEIEQESQFPMYHHYIVNNELKSAVESLFELFMPRCFPVKKDIF